MKNNLISRRDFLHKTASTTGMASMASLGITRNYISGKHDLQQYPREVWIAGLSQMGLTAGTAELMVRQVLDILRDLAPYKPDFVCLPEVFAHSNVMKKYNVAEKLEITKMVIEKFSEFSKQNNCYTICPVYTSRSQKLYNSAVVIDRKGEKAGIYDKIHLTEGEMNNGLTPGDLFQPIIKTDSGLIGIQICFDMLWQDGWEMYRKQGAEIIFWPSAYAGGSTVNTKAWQNRCVVASGTRKNTSKLCDISGQVITQTGIWNENLYCAPVNLEKVFLHTWPFVRRFKEIQAKYGRKVRITYFHEEEWSIIESLSPDVFVMDIMKEYDLLTFGEHKEKAEIMQKKARGQN